MFSYFSWKYVANTLFCAGKGSANRRRVQTLSTLRSPEIKHRNSMHLLLGFTHCIRNKQAVPGAVKLQTNVYHIGTQLESIVLLETPFIFDEPAAPQGAIGEKMFHSFTNPLQYAAFIHCTCQKKNPIGMLLCHLATSVRLVKMVPHFPVTSHQKF